MDYPQNLTASDRYRYDLIQKCRTSGKSDYQWLKDNNIKSPTFYYHVKQLRKKACELPEATKRASIPEEVAIIREISWKGSTGFFSVTAIRAITK